MTTDEKPQMEQEAEQVVAGTVEQEQVRDDYQDGIDDDLLVEDARHRPGKLTLALAAAIVIAGAFGGGVLTQKHYGTATTASGAAAGFARAAGGEGFPAGGFPGAPGGTGTGGAAAGAGTGTAGAAAGSGTTSSSVPVVVGTIVKVSGTTITVKNFGGTQVTVTVPDGATVSTSTKVSKLTAGSTVSVSGSKAADGSVTASSVTAQK